MWYHCLSLLIAPGGNPVGKDREEMISITSTIVMMLVFSWKQRRGSFYFHSIQKVITPPYKIYLNNESRRTERERWSGATNHSLSSNSKVEVSFFYLVTRQSDDKLLLIYAKSKAEYWHFCSFSVPVHDCTYIHSTACRKMRTLI